MAQLLIRQLPEDVKEALRERARASGRSMEAEARLILTDVVAQSVPVEVEYAGPHTPEALRAQYGVKLLPQRSDAPVTFEETLALIDEFV